jgi:hypothetical protein
VMMLLMEQIAYNTETLWYLFPYDTKGQDFWQDYMEVINGFEKLMEEGVTGDYLSKFRNDDRILQTT